MTAKATSATHPLRILVADDKSEFRALVIETLGTSEAISAVECGSLSTVQRLKKEDRKFDICILDVLFHRGVNQYRQIVELARAESPDALILALSDYIGNLSGKDSALTDDTLLKPHFRGSRELLIQKLISLIDKSKAIVPATKERAIAHFRRQENRVIPGAESADQTEVRELLEITGSVQQVLGPFVEVIVLNVRVDGKSPANEGRPERLLMPKTMFASKGLLGTFTQFRYRYWEADGRRIAEVFPRDNPDGIPLPADPALDRLHEIQKQQQRKHRKHGCS